MLINILKKTMSQKCHTLKCMSILEIKNPYQFREINRELLGFSSQIIKKF